MALKGMNRGATKRYVSDLDPSKSRELVPVDADKPDGPKQSVEKIDDGATVFVLGALDVHTMGRIYDSGSQMFSNGDQSGVDIKTFVNRTNIEAVKFGLKGWENFQDENGNDIPFKTVKRNVNGRHYEVVADECLDHLSVQLSAELGQEIKALSEVTAAEAKNSEGA